MEFALIFLFVIIAAYKIAEGLGKLFGSKYNSQQSTNSSSLYRNSWSDTDKDISEYGINEIKSSGRFTAKERAAEYRRRGKSPSGVIDGVYNDAYRDNGEYNDSYRDWDADA